MVSRIRIGKTILALACAWLSVQTAMAENEQPDTSDWRCKWCEFDGGLDSNFASGIGYVSDDSFKFGEYTGLGNKGIFAIVDGESEYRAEDGTFWSVYGRILGTDRISAGASAGKQGRYAIYLSYDQLPNLISDTARTPFSGDYDLQLPANWVRADTTDSMSALAASLQPVSLETERKKLTLGGSILPGKKWTLALRYRKEDRQGTRLVGAPIGGSLIANFPFQTRSALTPQPVDSVTHLLDATASSQGKRSNFSIGYQGSVFYQDEESLRWQNPFNDPTGNGADAGSISLPPDNEFHQIFSTLGYRFGNTTRLAARIAVGRMQQDERILPYSINPSFQSELPRETAEVEVQTLNYQLKLSSRPVRRLRLNASFTYNERENDTPQSAFDYVITDAALSRVPQLNRNYSFSRESIVFNGAYRFNLATRLSFGYERKDVERTLQQIASSIDNSYWMALSFSPHETLDFDIKYTDSNRDADQSQSNTDVVPPQNPLIRQFNAASRDQKEVTATISYTPNGVVGFGLTADYADSDYTETQIGLSSSVTRTMTADIFINPSQDLRIQAFVSHEDIDSTQLGSQSFSTPTWSADTNDSFGSAGLTLNFEPSESRVSVKLDYTFSESFGMTELMDTLDVALPFPDNSTVRHRAEFYLNYNASDSLSWRFGWLFEEFDSADWGKDGVAEDTIPNVLLLGQQSFAYKIHMPVISVRYQF